MVGSLDGKSGLVGGWLAGSCCRGGSRLGSNSKYKGEPFACSCVRRGWLGVDDCPRA